MANSITWGVKGDLDKRYFQSISSQTSEFVSRLRLVDEKGSDRSFDQPFSEQVLALEDFMSPA